MFESPGVDLPGTTDMTDTMVVSDLNGYAQVNKVDSIRSTNSVTAPVVAMEEERAVYQLSTSPSCLSGTKQSDQPKFIDTLKKKRVLEKFVYVTSVLTLAFLVHAVLTAQWLLPYYYAISAPVLILIRVVLYWKLKWQYFLLDFCYSANTLWYIFLWAFPSEGHLFCVLFSLANGPLLWATVIFRNSLVFHSLDKVTSSFIHLLPTFLSFGVRWYSSTISLYWYTPFISSVLEPSFIWLVAVPLACFVLHSLIYCLIVDVIFKPSEEFLTSYRYLTSKEGSFINKLFKAIKPRWRIYVYNLCHWVFCLLTLLLTRLYYEYFIAHCIAIAVVVLVCILNGASFYVDVFSSRGFQDED